jgi:hypothetical protein
LRLALKASCQTWILRISIWTLRIVYSGWHLCPLGQAKDAVLETGRIVAEDPLNLLGCWTYCASLFFARDFDRAAEEWSRLLDIDPSFPKTLQALSVARGYQGNRWRYFMVCWVKLTGRLRVRKKRTVIASPFFCSPTCNPAWIAFDRTRASTRSSES